jgi:hypothetical protein
MSGPWEKYQSAPAGPWAKYQAQTAAPSARPAPPPQPETYDPTDGMSRLQKFLAGTGKAFVDLGRGAGQLVGAISNEDVASARALDAPLMATRAGKVGNFAGNFAAAVPAAFVPGANTVAGAGVIGAGLGLLQPVESGTERAMNTGLGLVAGAGGQKAGQVAGKYLGGKVTARATAAADDKAANAVRDQTLAEARKLGYKVPPATVNQKSVTARAAESLAGKAATQQTAAVRNQQVTNRLVREELGLSKGATLQVATLKGIRERAGGAYRAVKGAGEVVTDAQYLDELTRLSESADEIIKDFPDLKFSGSAEIKQLQDGLLRDKFDASSAVEVVKKLRSDAAKNLAWNVEDPAKKSLGLAQREAAGIVEDQVIRHLEATGRGNLATAFDTARQTIAKTYSVQAALNEGSGNVVAPKLAAQLRKGKPLSGNLEKIARFAATVDNSVSREQMTSPGVSKLVASLSLGGAGGALATGNPALASAAIGLPIAGEVSRRAMLSSGVQRLAAPSYAPRNAMLNLMRRVAPLSAPVGIGVANTEQ